MFQWRLKLREANQALKAGRVDEARELLGDDELRDFLPAKQLAGQVAERITERARQRIAWGESAAGMADLEAAQQLGAPTEIADAVRHEYARAAAQQATERLAAGEPDGAIKRVERAMRRGVIDQTLRDIAELAKLWVEARGLADQGEMTAATDRLARTHRLAEALDTHQTPTPSTIKAAKTSVATAVVDEQQVLAKRADEHRAARERLQSASTRKEWEAALAAAEESLRLAPADTIATGLRRRIWKEVGLGLTRTRPGRRGPTPLAVQNNHEERPNGRALGKSLRDELTSKSTRRSKMKTDDTNAGAAKPDRRMLWIDAVGGFLVCLDEEIVIGQPAGGSNQVALPILADISRRHAVLRREAGSYVLQPLGPVSLDGRPIEGPTVLGDNQVIELSSSPNNAARGNAGAVRIRFTRPHALSATARLVIESGHRTGPSADAVLLMADSCVMGPSKHSHIACPGWTDDVIVFRKTGGDGRGELQCRSNAQLTMDGETLTGATPLSAGSRVEGEDFAISVEDV